MTGWSVDDARALYAKLKGVILPLFYDQRTKSQFWSRIMKSVITKNALYFNSHRMMRRYAAEAYLR